jgi:hypothetical protein
MAKRLKPQDARAVDLLLNKAGATSMRHESQYSAPTGDQEHASVARVEALLTLIQQWPVEEPPANLVERTMARIDAAAPVHPAEEKVRHDAPRLRDPHGPVS